MTRDPAEVGALVRSIGTVWLDELATKRGIADLLASERSRLCLIHRDLRDRLGAAFDPPSA